VRKEGLMAKDEGKKKPTVEADIACPHCGKKLCVAHFRKRTNPTVKAEHDVWTEVTADDQKTMFEDSDPETTVKKK
jgi:DNA-directed RNA polymerase subunit RPC12/RpoP